MNGRLRIGLVSEQTGVPARTIRFYEAEGILPPPQRTPAGYRLYSANDVRRLRLLHRVRLIGVSLPEARVLADQAFASTCSDYANQVLTLIARQKTAIDDRMAELAALRAELDDLEAHTRHDQTRIPSGQRVADCQFCPLIDEKGGSVQ